MEYPIPQELEARHNQLSTWIHGPVPEEMEMPGECSLRVELDMIERIARLEHELSQLTSLAHKLSSSLHADILEGGKTNDYLFELDRLLREVGR